MKRILVVDEDVTTHQIIRAIVQILENIEVQSSFSGEDAIASALTIRPDLLIVDAAITHNNHLSLTQAVRELPTVADLPIILLSQSGAPSDKYQAFLQGVDDYLVKPFDSTELLFRIKALLRRTGVQPQSSLLSAGQIELNPLRNVVMTEGQEIKLTGAEFAILRFLVLNPDRIVGVESLLNQALEYPARAGNPQVIHTHIKNIRAKFRNAGIEPSFLGSSRRGYMLITGV